MFQSSDHFIGDKSTRPGLHLLLLALFSLVIGILFLREPGFGDDFTYWSFAFELHERGITAWSQNSFHDLRWPVWGLSWILQAIFGPGLVAYYGVPLIYLTIGAVVAFTFGRLITNSIGVAWAAGIAFVLHPLLDTVAYRPMPDLSEGVLGGLIMLVWWKLTQSEKRTASIGWATLLGALVFIIESNRLTGVFIVPVLILCTVLYARRTFGWLVLAGCVSLVFYVAEAAFYHHLFGDWLHSLHANLGGKGRKGTEDIAVWYLPFRFLDTLWKAGSFAPLYCLLGAIGAWVLWRPEQRLGSLRAARETSPMARPMPLERVVVVWLVTLYLAYACAPQSIWPWRPIVRDADRFLCSLTIPFSVIAAVGLFWLLRQPRLRSWRWVRLAGERPIAAGVAAVLLLALISSRELINFGSIPEIRSYMRSIPEGTKIFTHDMMRSYSFLVAPNYAKRFTWLYTRKSILHSNPEFEELAARADEFWYLRKLVWLTTRKRLETREMKEQPPLASYFDRWERDWTMARTFAKGDVSDLVFHRRRKPDTALPQIVQPNAPELGGFLPQVPLEWKAGGSSTNDISKTLNLPESFRGKLCFFEIQAASNEVEAFTIELLFTKRGSTRAHYLLKPYLHPVPGKDFFEFQIPADADQCAAHIRIAKKTKFISLNSFRILLETPK